ncbi:DEAD/DEAH box helicase [Humisphaera borealis]|uniref:DEAD/DEAH box helicase n=1 Tax=Humisphaera borealis TaxID=2807512 RepID=A0A7M2WY11_9BACT|nr:DEAD/DEAH box helicase [Humisphaera borealis]QOV90388.1 DEAD/DEAH box helicase [Humisphaera borealis]
MISRDEIILDYLERLAYAPYPVQEEALYAWAASEQGVLLSAPTGTGKTLVAEAAVYEGLRTGKSVYYSTPLIALTDQKLIELQDTVERWGYERDTVGLVTGHRTVNPNAPIKVVVAEVLLNRLLHPEAYDFANVGAVVMDEFHNFNEPQRGIVWELALSLLPAHVRVMLLSATVGAASEFVNWMARSLDRRVTLVEGRERKVPLHFHWVGDELLPDFVESIARGEDTRRRTPLLIFCFDREICWVTADVLKGRDVFVEGQRKALLDRLESFDFSVGSGNKLRTFLTRGIGIHHAGLLPRYRRVVEMLFQEKLLPVCVCTETLAAGINLPARSVILTTLVKGPRDKKKLIDPSAAQQMFGRAGRPQFDTEGHVFAMAHEDDVKLFRWKEKYDSIPEDTKDPGLMKAKKALLKKKPTRRANFTYWNADQFTKLQTAPPARLASKGRLTWRWLGFLLEANPAVEPIRQVIRRRLMDLPTIEGEIKRLTRMLVTLSHMGVVLLDPPPPKSWLDAIKPAGSSAGAAAVDPADAAAPPDDDEDDAEPSTAASPTSTTDLLGRLKLGEHVGATVAAATAKAAGKNAPAFTEPYDVITATPTPRLKDLMVFRAVHPLYGLFLMDYLAKAEDHELVQILESLLEMPGSVAKSLRVPWPDDLPPGRLALEVVDPAILTRGLAAHEDLYPPSDQSDLPPEMRKYPVPLAQKVRMLFESEIDHAGGLFITPVWGIGDLLNHGGDFDKFVRSRDLLKQEGIFFKHVLRMILLCEEFAQLTPKDVNRDEWQTRLRSIAAVLTTACRTVDPQSTDEILEELVDQI